MQNQKEKLLGFSKKNILLTELAALFRIDYSDTKELYSLVTELGNQGLIKPVSASGKIANLTYPMYKKYKICAADEEYAADIKKILSLHPTITKSGYLSRNPKIYRENENFLAMLSKYFFTNRHAEYISRKERSYEIFGKEKVLDNPTFKRLLNNLKITDSDLMFYDTPEYCFHDFIPERKEHMTLLICENKDIWFNIRRRMFEENMRMLFGTKIDGVVYGAGNKVSEKSGALIQYVRFMGKRTADFLYWGDIDREGFDIFKRTREVNEIRDMLIKGAEEREILKRANKIVSSERLLHKYIKKDSIAVKVYKIDMTSENSGYKRWEEALTENSGAEKFVVFFAVVLTLMNYTRAEAGVVNKRAKSVLVLDNPFGKITSAHLLKPMFDIARHFNVQLICLSDINKSDVTNCFECVIKLVIKSQSLSNFEIMTHAGNEMIEHGFYKVMNGQMSLF